MVKCVHAINMIFLLRNDKKNRFDLSYAYTAVTGVTYTHSLFVIRRCEISVYTYKVITAADAFHAQYFMRPTRDRTRRRRRDEN